MSKNLGTFDRFVRLVGGSIFLLLSVFVFVHPVARLLVILFGLWGVLEGISGSCPLYYYLGHHKAGPLRSETALTLTAAMIQVVLGYVWWVSGWEKITDPKFIPGMGKTLAAFAAMNPYSGMREFLLGHAMRNAQVYGFLVSFGEYLIGVVLIALAWAWLTARTEATKRASVYISAVALFFGCVLAGVFYFAAGHLSPSTRVLTLVLFWIQACLLYGYMHLLLMRPARGKK